jgi:anhydro-N-acetylmuramic acid kinase
MKSLVVAGVMSGTSADGIDVALVRITSRDNGVPKLKLLAHTAIPYGRKLRAAVLAAMDAPVISAAELARLHWRLGEVYGDAIAVTQQQHKIKAHLAGVHGQTIYHQGTAEKYLGSPLRCTWQLGEAAEIAARTGLPVVSDFRPADMTAGGQGAPLVPIFDRIAFAHPKRNRILQNLGGIANLTAIPANSNETLAFDSGPANMLIDACMQRLFDKTYDRNGETAAKGKILQSVVDQLLQTKYFGLKAPKSCGREEFGAAYVDRLFALCRKARATNEDIVATATALTAQTILAAYRDFVWPFLGQSAPLADATDYIAAGGGTSNRTLMQQLRAGLEPLGIAVSTIDEHGIPSQAKEAMAFALLAWLRWNNLPGNVPSATGASKPMVLGKVTLA